MKPAIFTVIIMMTILMKSYGQAFNPDRAINSVVQIWVTNSQNTKEKKVLTGFIWQNPNQIVTALHGMQAGWKIEVKYPNQAFFREAKIKKVLPKADLVLLELSSNEPSLPTTILPIKNVFLGKVEFGEPLYCLGISMGSSGIPSRTLSKGFLQPKETLEFLVPQNVKEELRKTTLGLDLDIIYFDNGNLLPSNSGAPIFDKQGRLVGIGNGGLEKGTVNISWAIPAKYISELENSPASQLPGNASSSRMLFSTSIIVEESGGDLEKTFAQSNVFRPVKTKDIEFYKTKNRSIVDLTESSDNPSNIIKLNNEITRQFNIRIDLDKIRFDIYEDIQNGVIVVVPEGLNLDVINRMTDEEALTVRFESNDFTYLAYGVIKDDSYELNDVSMDEIIEFLDEEYFTVLSQAFGISGFYVADDYTFVDEDYASDRKTVHISATGAELVYSPMDGRQYGISTYITLLINQNKVILTSAVTAIPSDVLMNAAQFGINCMGSNSLGVDCKRFLDFYSAFTAAHLTTFAY